MAMTAAERMRRYRARRRDGVSARPPGYISAKEIAKTMGVSVSTIHRWELNRKKERYFRYLDAQRERKSS